MPLTQLLSRSRIAELESADLSGALQELLGLAGCKIAEGRRDELLGSLLERENVITTYLGHGVALPHIRIRMRRPYILAVGRSRKGVPYNSLNGVEQVQLIFMLLASERTRDYLHVLASIARFCREKDLVDSLIFAPDLEVMTERLSAGFGGVVTRRVRGKNHRVNRLVFEHAVKIARGADCSAVMVFGDVLQHDTFDWGSLLGKFRSIVVTQGPNEQVDESDFDAAIQVRSFARQRLSQLRSALLVGMTRQVVSFRDRICCVGGAEGSDLFDTVMVVEVEREFQNLLTDPANLLPPDVRPEVFERVVATATELSVEGREGRAVGALFVLGDSERVEKATKPLVLNPFFGYPDEDRNVLNPFMDETLKEFSSLDGAFVIRGDGVVLSAGSLILAGGEQPKLPGGLGARHAAAAAISKATDCIAIVVSSSTGQVSLFRRGLMVPLIEKLFAGGAGRG